jgi:hypothetical protein
MATDKYEAVKNTILDLYLKGYTKAKVAEALGMKNSQVAYILYSVLKVHQKKPRKMSSTNLVEAMPRDQVNRVITLASWGYNGKEIAEDTCLPYNRIQVLIKEATEKKLIKKMI